MADGGAASVPEHLSTDKRGHIVSVSRCFTDAHAGRGPEYFDAMKFSIKWVGTAGVLIKHKVGHGHFGDVFLAEHEASGRECVIKVLKPVKRDKINREVLFLERLKGGVNIVDLMACVKVPGSRIKCLVFEYVHSPDFKVLYPTFSDLQIRWYMYELVRGLEYTHSQGVMHRDIKPLNVLIDPRTHRVRIIDWGLAEWYFAGQPIRKWPGTRCYKGPELLLNYEYYDYAVDMWALGCMFGGMILLKHPLFRGRHTNANQVAAIVKVLGSADALAYIDKYNIRLSGEVEAEFKKSRGKAWDSMVTKKNKHLASPEALDFLARLTEYDHHTRITATEALEHPYFDPVRAGMPAELVATTPDGAAGPSTAR